jgi:vacuolar-type H+-ATPase subunit E/Vma4
MALSVLISHLVQEAQNRVQAIRESAEAEVLAIEAAGRQAVTDAMVRHVEHEVTRRQRIRQRELGRARREARARELEARHALLGRILERARALIPEVAASAAYRAALPSHLEEALSYLEGSRPRIHCQAALAPAIQSAIARQSEAQVMIDETVAPGVVAEAADGSVVVDNTLAARLARIEKRLAIELLQRLTDARA